MEPPVKINDMPIIGKALIVLVAFGALVVGGTLFTTHKMRIIDDTYSDLSDHNGLSAIMLARARAEMLAMRSAIGELLIAQTAEGNKAALDQLAVARQAFTSYVDAAGAALPAHAGEYQALRQSAEKVIDSDCAEAIRLGSAATGEADSRSQKVFLTACSPAFPALNEAFRKAVESNIAETKAINDATTDVTDATILTTWAIMLGGLAAVMSCGFFALRAWISKPLTTLGALMSRLAEGDLGVAVTGTERKDEIGGMARVVQVFKDNAQAKVRLEGQTAQQSQAADAERARSGAAQATAIKAQVHVVETIASGLSHLSNGQLTFRIAQPFDAEYETLRIDFNKAMTTMQDTMAEVAQNTSAIQSGSGEISTAADDLSKRTEQQAASLEETAAALDEITATVRKTAEGANHARQVVGTAKTDAEHSGEVVRQAVDAMSGIEKSSGQIGQIIGVIDEIAFQTNLLALNAGVEAARAGDAGRGFAVVASEVRALAQRSADAAKEIKALISASAAQVEQGVALVAETGRALERIVGQVNEINGIVGDIAASAQEQATGLDQVNTAVNQMDQVTQQNAAMAEQSTAASHALSHETEQLAQIIGRFEVGQGGARPGWRNPAKPAPKPLARPVAALKTVGRGASAVRKPEPRAEGQDWQEF